MATLHEKPSKTRAVDVRPQGRSARIANRTRVMRELPSASSKTNVKHSSFMDLPPELRVMVYDILFIPNRPINITTSYDPRMRRSRCSIGTANFYYLTRLRLKGGDLYTRPHIALACTSKQIIIEAASVLYGKNEFLFSDTATMALFLAQIGEHNVQLIKNLSLPIHSEHYRDFVPETDTPFGLLKPAVALQSLKVNYHLVGPEGQPDLEGVAGFLKSAIPFLKSWFEAANMAGSGDRVMGLVEFTVCEDCQRCDDGPGKCWCRWPNHQLQAEHCEEFEKEFKEKLAEALGIEIGLTKQGDMD